MSFLKQILSGSSTSLVGLGSNSLLFNILGMLKGRQHHFSRITIYKPPFWLDAVLPKYANKHWGQTPLGLPLVAKQLFHQQYPNYPDESWITWGMFQNMRSLAISEIQTGQFDCDVKVIDCHETPVITVEHSKVVTFSGNVLQNQSLTRLHQTFEVKDTTFVNWYRRPPEIPFNFQLADGKYKTEIVPPLLSIYGTPTSHLPETVMTIGPGLTTLWLSRDFPNIKQVVLYREKDGIPQVNPSNSLVNIDDIRFISLEQLDAVVKDGENGSYTIYHRAINDPIKVDAIFHAAGQPPFRFPDDVVSLLKPRNKYFAMEYESESVAEQEKKKWFHSKDTPIGSLFHAVADWGHRFLDYSWSLEPQFFHADTFPSWFSGVMRNKASIDLHGKFFSELAITVSELKKPLSMQEFLPLMMELFKKIQNPSQAEIRRFYEGLNWVFEENIKMDELLTKSTMQSTKPETVVQNSSSRFFSTHASTSITVSQEQPSQGSVFDATSQESLFAELYSIPIYQAKLNAQFSAFQMKVESRLKGIESNTNNINAYGEELYDEHKRASYYSSYS